MNAIAATIANATAVTVTAATTIADATAVTAAAVAIAVIAAVTTAITATTTIANALVKTDFPFSKKWLEPFSFPPQQRLRRSGLLHFSNAFSNNTPI